MTSNISGNTEYSVQLYYEQKRKETEKEVQRLKDRLSNCTDEWMIIKLTRQLNRLQLQLKE